MEERDFPVTLVLVSYNKEDVIGKVIDSVGKGSLVPDLIVVSDDGSTDGTLDAAEASAKRSGIPVKLLKHPRSGPYRLQTMRNSGVSAALEGMVFISDSDCLFGEYTLETHYEMHKRNPFAIGTGPRFEFLMGTSGPFKSMYCTLEYSHYPFSNYLVPFGANISFRKSLWRRLGGFDRIYEGSYGLDDHEFCLRAEYYGAKCISDPGGYLIHCPHETIFGGRAVKRNWFVFKKTFGLHIGAEEWWFVHFRVVPYYWKGGRKEPILGDKVKLNRWGAPMGFVPPRHLLLMDSLQSLITLANEYLEGYKTREEAVIYLKSFEKTFIPGTSIAANCLRDLEEAVSGNDKHVLEGWIEKYKEIEKEYKRKVRG